MNPIPIPLLLVALGILCSACGTADDTTPYSNGNTDPTGLPHGKADNPNADSNPSLANPPPEITRLAPEFFNYKSVFASTGIGVGRSPAGGIFLRASNCESVARHVNALITLRRIGDPSFSASPELAPAIALDDGWCEAKLDPILTPYLAQTFWKQIDDTAVDINCWGHALRTIHAIPSIVVAESNLFSHVLSSSQCHQLSTTDDLSPGDIIAIRAATIKNGRPSYEEYHGAVWVTDELWITKNGAGRFDISPSSFVMNIYGRIEGKPHCSERTDQNVSIEHVQDCGLVVHAFRCETLAKYRSQNPEGTPLFDSLLGQVRGLLDHRIIMQQEQEVMDDIVAEGTAYISRHPFSYVNQTYQEVGEEIPAHVASYLEAANKDQRLLFDYDLNQPALPGLPAQLVNELQERYGSDWIIWQGGGFRVFCDTFQEEHDKVFATFQQAEATLSQEDRNATISLVLQLASSDCRSWDATLGVEPYLASK